MTTSESGDGILVRLARRNGGDITTVPALADWLESGECPADAIRSAAWSTLELAAKSGDGMAAGLAGAMSALLRSSGGAADPKTENQVDLPDLWGLVSSADLSVNVTTALDPEGDRVIVDCRGHLASALSGVSASVEAFSYSMSCADMLELWNRLPTDERPRDGFPLEALYVAWLNRPNLVKPSARTKGRILPAKLAHVALGDRQAGRLFTVAAHIVDGGPESGGEVTQLAFSGFPKVEASRQQFIMPGFKEPTAIGPCLPLALYDLGDAPSTSRGPAAPLPLRLFVEAVLAVPMGSRASHTPVAMRVTLREMLEWLYPNPRKPRPNEYWPRLLAAFDALESPAARIPWYDPETGQGGLRRIVNISDIPRGPGKMDDLISIIVDLPPGSGNGPQVSDNLRYWGVKSAAGYRALLNLAYRWFEPGRTHFPVGRGRKRRWVQVNDPERYPVLKDDDLIALCFPTSARSARRSVLSDARKVVRQLEWAGELRVVEEPDGFRVLPPVSVLGDRE